MCQQTTQVTVYQRKGPFTILSRSTNQEMKYFIALLIIVFPLVASSQSAKSYERKSAILQPEIFGEGIISVGDYDSHPAFH
jgi:hypothetical protein